MATKRCYSCDKTKDVAEFPINRKRGDGLGTLCKACKKVYNGSGFDPLAAHGRVRQDADVHALHHEPVVEPGGRLVHEAPPSVLLISRT